MVVINITMESSSHNLVDLNSWYSVTTDYHFSVADIIVVNTTIARVETPYIFKRLPAFCYIEALRDYGMKYVVTLEFLDLINKLTTDFGHLRVRPSELGYSYVNKKHPSPDFSHHGPGGLSKATRPF